MSFPAEFYYLSMQSKPLCSEENSNALDIEAFLDGRAYWIQPTISRTLKQKKLIIMDWTLPFWPEGKSIKKIATDLISKGFSVYTYVDDQLIKQEPEEAPQFQSTNMPSLKIDQDSKFSFEHAERIFEAAIQMGMSRDEVFILDHYWLEALYRNDFSLPRTITLKDYMGAISHYGVVQFKRILEQTKSSKPLVTKIVNNIYSKTSQEHLTQLKELFPAASCVDAYQFVEMDAEFYSTMVSSSPSLISDDMQESQSMGKQYPELVSIKIMIDAFDWNVVFRSAAYLKKIDLSVCSKIPLGLAGLEQKELPFLEEIECNKIEWIDDELKGLFDKAPHLKVIHLSGCKGIFAALQALKPGQLKYLHHIEISDTELGKSESEFKNCKVKLINDVIKTLLLAAPGLEKINFSMLGAPLSCMMGVFWPENLPCLKEVNLSGTYITGEMLSELLMTASNLETIYLGPILISMTDNCFKPLQPNQLKHLRLIDFSSAYKSDLFMNMLESVLNAAPYLEEIICNHFPWIPLVKRDPNLFLRLKRLDLSCNPYSPRDYTITANDIHEIFTAMPNLEYINFSNSEGLSGCFNAFKPNQLKQLKAINLSNCTGIQAGDINALFIAAPSLEDINLQYCDGFSDCFSTLKQNQLSHLKKLNLAGTIVSSSDVSAFLNAAPSLLEIQLDQSEEDRLDFEPLKPNQLKKLATASFAELNLVTDDLENFFVAAPHIRNLNLYDTDLTGSFSHLKEKSLEHLAYINLSSCILSHTGLVKLLAAAPNIKKIDLTDYVVRPGCFKQLKANALPFLEKIVINESNLSSSDRKHLEKAAPKATIVPEEISSKEQLVFPASVDYQEQQEEDEFNHLKMVDFNPAPKDIPFEYTGLHVNPNQTMIIEKFSQYFTIYESEPDVVSQIQDGICFSLTHYFKDMAKRDPSLEEWAFFINTLQSWSGEISTLTGPLIYYCNELFPYVKDDYVNKKRAKNFLLGEDLSCLDAMLASEEALVLTNPWHAVLVLKRRDEEHYHVYDPNDIDVRTLDDFDDFTAWLGRVLGEVICVCHIAPSVPPQVSLNYIYTLIEKGGLISLSEAANAEKFLPFISKSFKCPKESLQGLLLRGNAGRPAWLIGLSSRTIFIHTIRLLVRFLSTHPDGAKELKCSMDAIDPVKSNVLTHIGRALAILKAEGSTRPAYLAMLKLFSLYKSKDHESALSTWVLPEAAKGSLLAYGENLLKPTQKQLIEFNSSAEIDAMVAVLEKLCVAQHLSYFYIDDPKELICSTAFVKTDDNCIGHIQPGPGGPLYDFIQSNQYNAPILIINYERFKQDDIVRFNSLLDSRPKADGTPLPINTTIIALSNKASAYYYNGSDFKSRFDSAHLFPFTESELVQETALKPIEELHSKENAVINLYYAHDWLSRLLGQWLINGQVLRYQEGALSWAVQTGQSIEIQNGPWEDEAFQRFWKKIRQGGVRHAGRHFVLPDDTMVVQYKGYDWDALNTHITLLPGLSPVSVPVLNPGTLSQFFSRYDVIEASLEHRSGYLYQSVEKNLVVNVTATLTKDEWAMLLSACQQEDMRLQAHYAPGVILPEELASPFVMQESSQQMTRFSQSMRVAASLQVIESTDMDTTIAFLSEDKHWQIIDISECEASDLLMKIDGDLVNKQTSPRFVFATKEGALLDAQKKNTNVILKGRFSPRLIDNLAFFLLEKMNDVPLSGQLIIVTSTSSDFSFLPNHWVHSVSPVDKIRALGIRSDELSQMLQPYLEKESLSQLQSRIAFLHQHPENPCTDGAWMGMKNSHSLIPAINQAINYTTSAQDAAYFVENRLHAVRKMFEHNPCVFLSGLSGIGKTTFVHNELCARGSGYELFSGEKQMLAWATHSSEGVKVLFLDEANLSSHLWSEFEGLYQRCPGLLIKGIYYPVTENHKVVFAGNPIDYSNERQWAPFFERHGCAVPFELLSYAVIYEKILKPLFNSAGYDSTQSEAISGPLLNAYALISEGSSKDVLISPRELEMMVLLIMCHGYQWPTHQSEIEQIVYDIGYGLIPQEQMSLREQFTQTFKNKGPIANLSSVGLPEEGFFIAPSRRFIEHTLQERLCLREWRIANQSVSNEAIQYGGLGGVILEGEPGIGKSELLLHVLTRAGYHQQTIHEQELLLADKKIFYMMPVSMAPLEKRALLLKAFEEGAIVVVDEINSSPMMEEWLNALLMGRHPESHCRPLNPGFMIIGTQNPASMAGRCVSSTAMQRRMTTIKVPEYTAEEMISILTRQGVSDVIAMPMVMAYEERRDFALGHFLTPAPCFRDLLKLSKLYQIKTKQQPILPSPVSLERVAVTEFFEAYSEMFQLPKRRRIDESPFGFFKQAEQPETLGSILQKAISQEGNYRKVCVKLGWMTIEGQIEPNAPEVIKQQIQPEITQPVYG